MAWIKVINKDEATGELKELYDHVLKDDDDVDNILSIHSLHPKTLEAHLMMYEELMRGENNLSKAQREMIGVLVSTLNSCDYWTTHHGEGLRKASNSELLESVKKDYKTANISKADKIMLRYAEKLTLTPGQMVENDVLMLRKVGFSDVDILDINQIVAYYAYVNRTADGLGVKLENFW